MSSEADSLKEHYALIKSSIRKTGKVQDNSKLWEELDKEMNTTGIRTMIIPAYDTTQELVVSNMVRFSDFYKESYAHMQTLQTGFIGSQGDKKTGISAQDIDVINQLNDKKTCVTKFRSNSDGSRYLCFFGVTDGYLVMMTSSLQNIKVISKTATQFVLIVGIGAIAISIFLSVLLSDQITKPLTEMAKQARNMADLNFDQKIKVTGNDELSELAGAMNSMSENLERAISELKSANLELSKDVERKTRIDEARKEFVSNVSHELKTPIALIQGYAEGLVDGIADDPDDRNYYCEVIMDEANKMNNMVKKLLDLTQLEFGGTSLSLERFDVCQVIQNKIASSRILLENATIEFDEKPCFVWADEFLIEDAFSNYLSNAIHHVRDGGKIRVWLGRGEDSVRVHVENDGTPIPTEDLEHLWDKFYKVDKARTREYGGSGIGLSIVAAIMDAHGKAYGVNNLEDGVDFYFDVDTKN